MASILSDHARAVLSADRTSRPRMAKADLRKAEVDQAQRRVVGQAIKRAVDARGWSLKEFAAQAQRDERQCARWFDGTERAPLDVLLHLDGLGSHLIVQLAQIGGAEIETIVRVKVIA